MVSTKGHSEDYLGESRDFWWNSDFIALMARRWRLDEVHTVLDVGSGRGHWGRILLPHLPTGASIEGIDPEERWVEEATAYAARHHLSTQLHYRRGSATKIPFGESAFDFVTCQTVLVHVPDVYAALREMLRVLKRGGLLAVAEPNNLALSVILGCTRFREDPEITLAVVRLQLICERGKEALGEGHNSIGDLLPGYFNELGLREITVYQSDHASPMFPPYDDPAQIANRNELVDLSNRDFYIWDRPEAERYFRAGGGSPREFDHLWTTAVNAWKRVADALRQGKEHQAGGSVFYLISGRKL
jgi:SAM-dependent methyltransferase